MTVHQSVQAKVQPPKEKPGAPPPVSHDDRSDTAPAPRAAPQRRPRPPIATQTAR
jgi:hypothetical protein